MAEEFKQVIAEVKHAYDIRDYIEAAGVSISPAGSGRHKGLCPFHDEKTPSFTIDESFQNYRCFGCGANGDIITFVQEHDSVDFMEALTMLAEDKGIKVPSFKDDNDNTPKIDYPALKECIRQAANFFWEQFKTLPDDHPAVREIASRGLNPRSGLYGYAPSGKKDLYNHLHKKGFTDDTIITTGVCSKTERGGIVDFWSGRLMFFVQDASGKVVGFSGRKLYETDYKQGKYVNSPSTPLFHKSKVLYNLPNARKALKDNNSTLFVAEGQFDVIALSESGVRAVVAGLGTAFTEEQGSLCRRMVGPNGKIVFCFDGDQAGVKAAVKVFTSVPSIQSVSYVAAMPEGQDPCDMRMTQSPDSLKTHVETQQIPLVEFVLDAASTDYNMEDSGQRARYVEHAASIIKTISSHILKEEMIRKVSLETFSPSDIIRDAVEKADRLTPDAFTQNTRPASPVAAPVRPVIDSEKDINQEEVIRLIEQDRIYAAAARSILLSIRFPQFREETIKRYRTFPKELILLLKDLNNVRKQEKVLPEDFKLSQVVTYIMSNNLIPSLTIMSDQEIGHLNSYLLRYLTNAKEDEKKRSVQEQIMATLNNNVSSIEMLQKAIDTEKRLLGIQP